MSNASHAKGTLRRHIGSLVILVGLGLFFYPEIRTGILNYQTRVQIREFQDSVSTVDSDAMNSGEMGPGEKSSVRAKYSGILRDFLNREWEDGRADSEDGMGTEIDRNPESNPPSVGTCLGYIQIPAMSVTLPLYYGTDAPSLAKGAGILEDSDLPYGGIGHNCVIAGHRGYRGAPYFREIEVLKEGDVVQITNERECLTYRVSGIVVIEPSDRKALEPEPDLDRITLMTCHPYRSHGRYRYLVFCDRETTGSETVEGSNGIDGRGEGINDPDDKYENKIMCMEESDREIVCGTGKRDAAGSRNIPVDIVPVSWNQDIHLEDLFRLVCAGIILLFLFVYGRKISMNRRNE